MNNLYIIFAPYTNTYLTGNYTFHSHLEKILRYMLNIFANCNLCIKLQIMKNKEHKNLHHSLLLYQHRIHIDHYQIDFYFQELFFDYCYYFIPQFFLRNKSTSLFFLYNHYGNHYKYFHPSIHFCNNRYIKHNFWFDLIYN